MPPSRKRLEIPCGTCGTTVYRLECQMVRDGQRVNAVYCSRDCLGSSKRNGSELFCSYCDSPFYRRFGEQDLKVRVRQFCSRGCYREWRIVNRKQATYPKIGSAHEHRIVAENHLGRKLFPEEVVHHIDLNRHNAKPENLAVFPDQSTHMRCHMGNMSNEELRRFSLI